MKICPRCQKTYSDDNLNFCLEDGSVLSAMSVGAMPPDTVHMPQMPTAPQQQPPTQPSAQAGWNVAPQQQQYSMQPPKKSSKMWIWVLVIFGGIILLCGGGFVGLVFLGSQVEKSNTAANSDSKTTTSNSSKNFSSNTNSGSSTTPSSGRDDVEVVDMKRLVQEFSAFGNTELTGGEFFMSSKQKGYYYAIAATEEYTTEKSDTRVTVRNVDNASGSMGYGLVFHSDTRPLQQGYAFLIDSKRKKYRVVHHIPKDEKTVINWTTSAAIKEGGEDNVLEVRDLDDTIDLYINGTKVNSIRNVYGYSGGVAGLYSGDAVKAGFKNFEIRK
jgi:hypothetical protein